MKAYGGREIPLHESPSFAPPVRWGATPVVGLIEVVREFRPEAWADTAG